MISSLSSQGQQLREAQGKITEEDPCHPNKWNIHITHSRIPSPTQKYTYLHIAYIHVKHISTRTYHIHHKGVVTVVCRFGHFWLSYSRCAMSGALLVMLLGLSW